MTDEFGRQLVVARERVREIAEQDPSAPAARSADDFPISNAIPPNATPAASFVARSILALARDGRLLSKTRRAVSCSSVRGLGVYVGLGGS